MQFRPIGWIPLIALMGYAISAKADPPQCTGLSEIMGNDMMVSLGQTDYDVSFYTHGPTLYATWNTSGALPVAHAAGDYRYAIAVAGTLLHELGHNLNLCHQGAVTDASGTEVIFATSDNGRLYKVAAQNGAPLASADTRRPTCPDDKIKGTPAVQLYAMSNPLFQSTIMAERGHPDDLVFVVTNHGCGDDTGNQVRAYYSSDLTPRWIFNSSGTFSMGDASDGCEVDYGTNQLYCGTEQAMPGQSTLWALQTIPSGANGSLVWSYNAGSIKNRPILGTGKLYVVPTDGTIRCVNPSNGANLWTLPTGSSVVRNITVDLLSPLGTRIYYTTSDGRVNGTLDNFPSPVPLWPPVSPPGGGKFTSMPAFALGTGKLYLSRDDGSIQQLSADTGSLESLIPVGRPGTLWDPVPAFSSATAQSHDRLNVTTTEGGIHRYCISTGTTGVSLSPVLAPLALAQNAPNPFSTHTRIEYRLAEATRVEIEVFAIDGRVVRRLVHETQPAGSHDTAWDGRDDAGRSVATGPYFYRMRVIGNDGRTLESSKKIQLVR